MALLDRALARSTFFSYETRTNSIDDGTKHITRVEERNYDSLSPETVKQKLIVGPSKLRAKQHSNWINRQQMLTNSIGTSLERPTSSSSSGSAFEKLFQRLSNNRLSSNPPRRGFINRARTVESPALSVDSGGQASSSLAQGMAKLLDVKKGNYADFYNRIDRPNLPTKRPAADAIEEAMRASATQMFMEQQRVSAN